MRLRLLLLFALLALLVLPTFAQETTDEGELSEIEVTFIGEVTYEEVDGETVIMVGGVIIAPASAFNPAFLLEGTIVEITGILLNDDTLRATSINFDPELSEDIDEADDEEVDEEVDDAEDDDMDDEDEANDEDTDEVGRNCVPQSHPVANRIAETFDVSVAEIIALHCDGNGFGNIARAYLLAEATEGDANALLEQGKASGWGAIIRESGVHPSQLAPGRMGRNADTDTDAEGDGEVGTTSTRPGNSGNAPGNSGNAPGNSGNAPGNSGNANPGNSGNAPGNSGNTPGGGGRGGGRP